MTDIGGRFREWMTDGSRLREQVEAERDACVARIDRERLALDELNEMLREIDRRLDGKTSDDPDQGQAERPFHRRIVKMTRAEQRAVPVEYVAAKKTDEPVVETAPIVKNIGRPSSPRSTRALILDALTRGGALRAAEVVSLVHATRPELSEVTIRVELSKLTGPGNGVVAETLEDERGKPKLYRLAVAS